VLKIIDEDVTWSDGRPLTIEDIFFTYDEILRKNRRDLQSLNTWNSVTVSLEDGKVKVSFPTISEDNFNFFTNAILPKHIVESMDLVTYKNYFSLAPITD
jgi:ABC-type transport system substrate-binding protein